MVGTERLPIELPAGWIAEDDSRGTVITAIDARGRPAGSVTVCTKARGYTLGVAKVRRARDAAEDVYKGLGWQVRLFSDAVCALSQTLEN
ncbi:hypothetical protein C6Q28_25185 [Burkholderia multivorans]|uniref:Uncharacterized protein n=2 Tax=Burkholderia multivorans TaxID=87883 RepID=A0A0H3KSI2_BURM1|nr:conserved hypothetical protein [Burkholderia multivorans ATCC 17616]PRF54134.1 hypothetical protein C6Q28_25185 [Burkholderia multivorans]PRF56598.1 hypothetical protein C6Q15_24540 [Burkholderia multivorans]BAG48027.1 hypothetical protein BMULJ_06238 [Burkholderia multivorans ATCC 17616]